MWVESADTEPRIQRHHVCVCMLSHVCLFATPWTVAHQAPLCMGLSQQEHWNGLPFPIPGDLSDSGIEPISPKSPASPALAGGFLYHCNTWETLSFISSVQFSCSVMSEALCTNELQHPRPPCPSPTPGVHSNSCPSSQ